MRTVTITLTALEDQNLQKICRQSGKTKQEWISETLKKALSRECLHYSLQKAHALLTPEAQAAGWKNEDDILNEQQERFK